MAFEALAVALTADAAVELATELEVALDGLASAVAFVLLSSFLALIIEPPYSS